MSSEPERAFGRLFWGGGVGPSGMLKPVPTLLMFHPNSHILGTKGSACSAPCLWRRWLRKYRKRPWHRSTAGLTNTPWRRERREWWKEPSVHPAGTCSRRKCTHRQVLRGPRAVLPPPMPLPTTVPIHKPRGFWTGGLGSFCLFSTTFPFQDHVNRYKYFKHFHLDHTVISLDKTTGK